MELIYTVPPFPAVKPVGFYCKRGAKTLVCAQQPELEEKQLHGETFRGSAALSQTEQLEAIMSTGEMAV